MAAAAPAFPTLRRRKSAAERRAQYVRAEARTIGRFLKAIQGVSDHRGNEPTRLCTALVDALNRVHNECDPGVSDTCDKFDENNIENDTEVQEECSALAAMASTVVAAPTTASASIAVTSPTTASAAIAAIAPTAATASVQVSAAATPVFAIPVGVTGVTVVPPASVTAPTADVDPPLATPRLKVGDIVIKHGRRLLVRSVGRVTFLGMFWTVDEHEDPMVYSDGRWDILDGLAAIEDDKPLPVAWARFLLTARPERTECISGSVELEVGDASEEAGNSKEGEKDDVDGLTVQRSATFCTAATQTLARMPPTRSTGTQSVGRCVLGTRVVVADSAYCKKHGLCGLGTVVDDIFDDDGLFLGVRFDCAGDSIREVLAHRARLAGAGLNVGCRETHGKPTGDEKLDEDSSSSCSSSSSSDDEI
jgi:hypothetical protein